MAREGLIIKLIDSSGQSGYGEWSEWPPKLPNAQPFASAAIRHRLSYLEPTLDSFDQLPRWNVSGFDFAIHTAWMDLRAKLLGKPLCKLINDRAHDAVQINGLIDQIGTAEAVARARALAERGISSLKLKLGRPRFADDLEVVQAIRKHFPSVTLRCDVNGAWGRACTKEAVRKRLEKLAPFSLTYIEEPIAGLQALAALQGQTTISLAADESLACNRTTDAATLPYWIIKPSRVGSFTKLREMVAAAARHQCNVVFTGVFESAVGTAAIAHLAASWLRDDTAMGLDTAPLFIEDTATPLQYSRGRLWVGNTVGLGVVPSGRYLPGRQTNEPI